MYEASDDDFDLEDGNNDLFNVGQKVKIDLADMDYKSWRDELRQDAETLELLILMVSDITPQHDTKLQELFRLIEDKMAYPINEGNRKILIFSAFTDTADYLYDQVGKYVKSKYGLNTAIISGTVDGRTTIKGLKPTLNNILTCFSPISKNKAVLLPHNPAEIDILMRRTAFPKGKTSRTATTASTTTFTGTRCALSSALDESTALAARTSSSSWSIFGRT